MLTPRTNNVPTVTRRAFLLTFTAGFTVLADELIRLMRVCRFDGDLRLAGAG